VLTYVWVCLHHFLSFAYAHAQDSFDSSLGQDSLDLLADTHEGVQWGGNSSTANDSEPGPPQTTMLDTLQTMVKENAKARDVQVDTVLIAPANLDVLEDDTHTQEEEGGEEEEEEAGVEESPATHTPPTSDARPAESDANNASTPERKDAPSVALVVVAQSLAHTGQLKQGNNEPQLLQMSRMHMQNAKKETLRESMRKKRRSVQIGKNSKLLLKPNK
jgi:hypothetical protein